MASPSKDPKKINLRFYSLAKKLSFLKESQRKIRLASLKAPEGMQVDYDLIDLDVDLANGLITYEEGFFRAAQLEDKLLETAVELALDLKKKLQAF